MAQSIGGPDGRSNSAAVIENRDSGGQVSLESPKGTVGRGLERWPGSGFGRPWMLLAWD